MSKEQDEMNFGTADFSVGTRASQAPERETDDQQLAALFPPETAEGFRAEWDAVQIGFVDDPRKAVRQADELVASVMKTLAESFASQRIGIETDVGQDAQASTENLRVALRRYRSFFERLLTL